MALIDKTYFVGELDIPNTPNANVEARLNLFIEKYEEKFLRSLFGPALYTDFIAGIQVDPMDEAWSSLLYGSGAWRGLVAFSSGVTTELLASGNTPVIVGGAGAYDPAPMATTATIPPAFVGRTFALLQRGVGELIRGTEYSVAGNVVTLLGGLVFSNGDTFFYSAPYSLTVTGTSTYKQSLIANYVYYWWMRDSATKTMGIGEGKPQLENATMADTSDKVRRAWGELIEQVQSLYDFLDLGGYVNWNTERRYGYYLANGRYVRNDFTRPLLPF